MIQKLGQIAFLGCVLVGVQSAHAGTAGLADWCFNANGDTSNFCNGGGNGTGAFADGTTTVTNNMDFTPEPANNSLGNVVFTLADPGFVAFYADYDIDYGTYGSFADSATVVGSLPTGVSFELADPNNGNLFSDFSALSSPSDSLANTNTVGTPAAGVPPNECCDVAWALDVASGAGTVTFAVTDYNPGTSFYIQQTNQYTQDSIYLSLALTTPR